MRYSFAYRKYVKINNNACSFPFMCPSLSSPKSLECLSMQSHIRYEHWNLLGRHEPQKCGHDQTYRASETMYNLSEQNKQTNRQNKNISKSKKTVTKKLTNGRAIQVTNKKLFYIWVSVHHKSIIYFVSSN